MEFGGRVVGLGVELLNHSNYRIWRTCMESYLIGEDLWEIVGGNNTTAPEDNQVNADAVKKWRTTNAKAEFILKRSISHDLFEHIMTCKSASDIWTTLESLLNKKNMARLQLLENELANLIQGDLSISQYFLRVKNLCSEISLLDKDEAISEARMKRFIIRGLRREYIPFVTSIQGWQNQPSLVELENLLASQESLARQMAGTSLLSGEGEALFSTKKKGLVKENDKKMDSNKKEKFFNKDGNTKKIKCYRCGKLGHIKRNCRVRLKEGNAANNEAERKEAEEDWGKCFIAENTMVRALSSINFQDDWIVDSGCGHHLTGDDSKFTNLHHYEGNDAIITADNTIHQVEKEGTITIQSNDSDPITLRSVYHVPGMKKNLFSVANEVDAGHYVLFGPKDVKFLRNLKEIKADIVYTGKRVKDLYVLSASNSYVNKMNTNDSAAIWHARLGHINMDKLKAIVANSLIRGLPNLSSFNYDVCEGCQYGKQHRRPFDYSLSRCKAPLELIHSDLMGPTQTSSFSGNKYMLLFVDDFTRFTWVYFVKEKSEVFSKFQDFKTTVESVLEKKIKRLRTDNGGEFTSKEFFSFCQKHGIKRELSCAETPQQNGVAERKIRHLMETCRSWLYAKNLPKALWAEGMATAAYVINRVPLSPINMKSPYELMFGEKPSVKHFKVFGCPCYVHIPASKRSKLDPKAKKCVFIGYDERKKGWKCMDPETHKFVVSRDVVFDEVSSYYSPSGAILQDISISNKDANSPSSEVELPITSSAPMASESSSPPSSSSMEKVQSDRGSTSEPRRDVYIPYEEDPKLRRSKRQKTKPVRYRDGDLVSIYSCFFFGPLDDHEPTCFKEAKNVKEWEEAMDEEMKALIKNETWDLVPKPKDVDPITCKWVYKLKRKADGSIDRYKARLVARGFSQKYGEDYEEIFSPVAKMTSVRMVIALAASLDWKLWQLDVKNAFLYGEIDKDIFMEQPPGYISNSHPDYVCKLKKALYGLKQAPRAWYGKIAQYLQFCGYFSSQSDPSLFVKRQGILHIIVLLYVDDMIITGNDENEVSKLRADLSLRFEMKDLGELHHFLGLEIARTKNDIFVGQQAYVAKLVDRFGIHQAKRCSTPLDANIKLRRDDGKALSDPRPFRALVGSLIYLTITRPDIAYSVGFVSRFMQTPRKPHLDAAKRILKYINSTSDFGLLFKKEDNLSLHGYTDADLGGDLDDRRSTSGYVFLFGSTCVSWCSKKQDSVSLSTTEAEYKASSLASQECVWLKKLVEEVYSKIYKPIILHCDNQSALKLAINPVCHARTKHIEIEHHFIREKVLDGTIQVMEVRSKDNVADIFTKSLSKGPFEDLRAKLGLVSKNSL